MRSLAAALCAALILLTGHARADEIVAHPAGCPARLFCGCGASVEIFGHPVRELYLVQNWRRRYPRAFAAAPGMAVLWGNRHVAVIRQSYGDGTAMLYDANSGGGLTRIHRVSIAGLTIVNPHAGGAGRWAAY